MSGGQPSPLLGGGPSGGSQQRYLRCKVREKEAEVAVLQEKCDLLQEECRGKNKQIKKLQKDLQKDNKLEEKVQKLKDKVKELEGANEKLKKTNLYKRLNRSEKLLNRKIKILAKWDHRKVQKEKKSLMNKLSVYKLRCQELSERNKLFRKEVKELKKEQYNIKDRDLPLLKEENKV